MILDVKCFFSSTGNTGASRAPAKREGKSGALTGLGASGRQGPNPARAFDLRGPAVTMSAMNESRQLSANGLGELR